METVETRCALCWQLNESKGEVDDNAADLDPPEEEDVQQPPRPPRRREKSPDNDDSLAKQKGLHFNREILKTTVCCCIVSSLKVTPLSIPNHYIHKYSLITVLNLSFNRNYCFNNYI